MQVQNIQKPLIDPYRTLGIFVSGSLTLSKSNPPSLTAPTGSSFRVYSQTLGMKVVSPPLGSKVTYACSYNEYTYVRVRDSLLKLKYHHIVKRWNLPGQGTGCKFILFDKLIVVAENHCLTLIDEQTGEISTQKIQMEIEGISHPVTYINKLLIHSKTQLVLVNVMTGKTIYNYKKLRQMLEEYECKITVIEAAPLVDIVGVGMDNGTIAFVNIKKDQIVFTVRQKMAVSCLTFSEENAWMASGDAAGNVFLWDLENKKILYKFQECLKGEIDSLMFMPGLPVLTCSSSKTNSIKQLRINLQDNKILSLLRERIGCTQPFESIVVGSNNQIVVSTASNSIFMALYSQCNNYILPKVLHSQLPYHLVVRHFNVELWKERTLDKSFKLHQYAVLGKISLSRRYYVVATARRVVKLGGSSELEWNVAGVKSLFIYNQHSIFLFTEYEMVVCDFNTNTILKRIEKKNVCAPSLNVFGNLIAFSCKDEGIVQIWDMMKIVQGRIFKVDTFPQILGLSFTADNKFLISSHKQGVMLIWNVVEGQLYKQYKLSQDMVMHCFTPDNQFMLSIFRGGKEVNIWNNYLGKLSSSRERDVLQFVPEVRQICEDYRKELTLLQGQSIQNQEIREQDFLDDIPDVEDGVPQYTFKDINRWMPLVFYDEIKARNTPEMEAQGHSLPFFLDFKNLTEEKKKIEEEIRKETMQKKKEYLEQKDKHLKSSKNTININMESSDEQYMQTLQMLNRLSVAEVDYQLRSYLMIPGNAPSLLKMVVFALKSKELKIRQQIKNIITSRTVTLVGTDLLTEQALPISAELLDLVNKDLSDMKEKVDRCITIADHHMK